MKLWWYLGKEYLKLTFGILGGFLSLFVVFDFFEQNSRYFPKYNASAASILEYYLTQLPKLYYDFIPFCSLTAAITVLWIFSRSNEISAMRAAGMSISRICSPMLFLAFGISLLTLAVGEWVMPKSLFQRRYVEVVKIQHKNFAPLYTESSWIKSDAGFMHFTYYDRTNQSVINAEIYKISDTDTIKEITFAPRGHFDEARGLWVLDDARVIRMSPQGIPVLTPKRPHLITAFDQLPPKVFHQDIASDELSYMQLKELIDTSLQSGGDVKDRLIDLHQKISLPFSVFLLAIYAMPFALRKERQVDTYVGVVLTLLVAVFYWVGNMGLRSKAHSGGLDPMLAAWTMNGLLLLGGLLLTRKLDKGQ